MNQYPRSVSEATLKCIPCNAPLSETIGDQYVCIECGGVRISRRPRRSFRDDLHGVSVLKEVAGDKDTGLTIGYTIESNRDDGVFVRFVDRSPGAIDGREFAVRPEDEADNWRLSGSTFTYSRRVGGGESTETSLEHPDPPAHVDSAGDLRIEVVQPLEQERSSDGGRVAVGARPGRRLDPYLVRSPNGRSESWRGGREQSGRVGRLSGGITSNDGGLPPGERGYRSPPMYIGGRSDSSEGRYLIVAIPAFNEADTVSDVVSRAQEVADAVTVVDDGSDDHTAATAAGAGARVIEHDRNLGYGAALKTIFRDAAHRNADRLVVLDADSQHDPADVPKLLERQRSGGAEIVIGSRFVDGSETKLPAYRRLGLVIINLLTNLSMGVVRPRSYVRDTQSGFRLYSERAIAELAREDGIGDRMDASLDILFFAHQRDYRIEEVGVTINYEVENANSSNPLLHGYQLVNTLLKTIERERPLLSLGLPGLLMSVGGVGFALFTFDRYLQTGTLSVGIVAIAIVGTVVGLFSCFTAIVLHALHTYFRNGF